MTKTVTISEAARILGKSRRTVQRMCMTATLKAEKIGGVWAITLPAGVQEAATAPPAAPPDDMAAQRAAHDATMADVMTRLAVAEARLAEVVAERDRLLAQLEEAQRQAAQLTATLFQVTAQRALPAPGKRPWWQFWRRDDTAGG